MEDNMGPIIFFVAIGFLIFILVIANKKDKKQDRSIEQKRIDLGINHIPSEDLDHVKIKELELLNKIANNSSSIKTILLVFIAITIIGFLASIFNAL